LAALVAGQTGQSVWQHIDTLVDAVAVTARAGDAVVVMSNGGFGGIHEKLLQCLGKTEDVG
jgi:UDP-N-acetylmuramate: L-alanyl-gamma-D-glutamyl-meso-diaminopimelate ligase